MLLDYIQNQPDFDLDAFRDSEDQSLRTTKDRLWSIVERTEASIGLLNSMWPDDEWWDRIDLPTLNMANCVYCVLGQATGGNNWLEQGLWLGLTHFDRYELLGPEYAFDTWEDPMSHETFGHLKAVWKEAITWMQTDPACPLRELVA